MVLKRITHFVLKGWNTACSVADAEGMSRFSIFCDMIRCRFRYRMDNQDYLRNEYWQLSAEERKAFASRYRVSLRKQREWDRLYHANWRFFSKWSSEKYSTSPKLTRRRCLAYKKHFGLTYVPHVQYGVKILCEHGMHGRLEIGRDVYLLKECFIDYTGSVTIKDRVYVTYGAVIQTHYHPSHSDWSLPSEAVQTEIVIEEGAVIGTRAIVMPTCHYIGKNARVGAGAVVTHDVPDYAVVTGVPARIVRYQKHD